MSSGVPSPFRSWKLTDDGFRPLDVLEPDGKRADLTGMSKTSLPMCTTESRSPE